MNAVLHDLVCRNAAQVPVALELDEDFTRLLEDPTSQRLETVPPSSALAERDASDDDWMVLRVSDDPGSDGKSMLLAARASLWKELTRRRLEKRFDGKYRGRGGNAAKRESRVYSRLLMADVI